MSRATPVEDRPPVVDRFWLTPPDGLSQALLARATSRIAIPMRADTESLNASAAAAVVLFELVRRRDFRQAGR